MVYPESAMTRRDISSEKENLVPRAHKSELASAGLGSVRTRGLMSSEQRSHAVLKESALQNQTPSSVNLSKTNIGSTEKDWLKKSLSDYSNGKQCAGSLERLREKIGQLKSVGAVKPVSQNAHRPLGTSALEHHFVGELHTRGAAPNVSDVPVHVYKDEKVSGGTQRETIKTESQRRKREMLEKRIVSIAEQARNVAEQDTTSEGFDDFDKLGSLSTPSKSSSGKGNQPMQGHLPTISSGTPSMKKYSASDYFDGSRQSVHNKVGSGGYLITEKQSISTFLTEKELKITVDQDNQGNCPLSSESALNISPSDQEVKGSRESSVERPVEIIEIQSVKFERSRYGGAMRVRRAENPKVTRGSDDHSPGSEKSTEDDQSSPGSPHAPKTSENIVNIHASAPTISEACTLSASKRANLNSSAHTVEGYLSEHRKRKAEADPSVTVTSLLLSGVCIDSQISEAHEAHEAHESVSRGRSLIQRERERKRERGREIMVKETKPELDALEQSGEGWNEDVAGHPSIATKGTSGMEREPWAWKTARDSRSVALPSPTLPEFSKSGKLVGGIPPRYIPPTLETRERKTEANDSPALDGVEHHAGVLKQTTEREGCEQNNGVISHSNTRVKGLGSTDDGALNHLADSFSSISIEEKSANGFSKILTQARAQTQVSGHHTAESASHTGVTGVTSLTGLSVGVSHKTALTSSHGVDLQHKPQNVLPNRERDRATELSDRSGLPKSSARVIPTAAEVPVHEVHEGHSAKSSDPPKDRGDKDQEMPPHNSQPARKTRAETENDKFVYVNGIRYQKLGKIGKGGSSEVFKVIAADCSIYALKRINLKGRDWSTAQEFYQEIKYLKGLRGKRHIIQLVDSEVINKKVLESKPEGGDTSEEACIISEEAYIYMVLEYGEIDLAGMLAVKRKEMQSNNETKLDENWLRYYWQQILEAVKTIHDERIVHSDLKPANFMLVRGELKLIDFGIAKAIQSDTTNIVKQNQNGTLNYMAPEAFLQHETDEAGVEIKIGRASDIWSLGCIFYQMVYGQTPFAELSFYPKITAITSRHHKIHYPRVSNPWLLDIMKRCLMWDRRKRLRIPELLEHPFIQPQVLLEQIYQTLARTSTSGRSQVIDLILSGYDSSWGHKNGAQSGHHSPS